MLSVNTYLLLGLIIFGSAEVAIGSNSKCPPREMLYPCFCTSTPLTKKTFFTTVICSFMQDATSMENIFNTLHTMVIDRLLIIDSFWTGEEKSIFPENWISLLKIKDLEIIDSKLSSSFACRITYGCPNTFLTHLTIKNSTSSEIIKTLCENTKIGYWTNCFTKLQHVSFSHNHLVSFNRSVFPATMEEMVSLNLSYNKIQFVGPSSFERMPRLTTLDISNNQIKTIDQGIFGKKTSGLEHFIISWNKLTEVPSYFFSFTPGLQTFDARGNELTRLPEEQWRNIAQSMKLIDLRDNFIHCDCHILWINCTLPSKTKVYGSCTKAYSSLRAASNFMNKWCSKGDKDPIKVENKPEINACRSWWQKAECCGNSENRITPINDLKILPEL